MKYSRQRELILEAVCSNPVHPTADAVYEAVRRQEPRISLGTVYRNLNQLAECGKLLKLSMPIGGDRFDGRLDDHPHIVCSGCGAVADVVLENQEEMNSAAERQTGYLVTGRTVVFCGVCANCRTKQ